MCEIARRFAASHGTGFRVYLALECALMRRYVARGGTEAEFCERLGAAFHRRHRGLLDGAIVV
ncbi:MAG: hypothetical protein ACREMQ_03950 [Longimicrobiales bacterium]